MLQFKKVNIIEQTKTGQKNQNQEHIQARHRRNERQKNDETKSNERVGSHAVGMVIDAGWSKRVEENGSIFQTSFTFFTKNFRLMNLSLIC